MIPLLLAAAVELRLDYTRVSLTKTVRHYTQVVDGVEVAGSEQIEENGRVTFSRVARASSPRPAQAGSLRHTGAYVNANGELRPARHVIEFARPMEPYERWYDAETGALLRERRMFYTIKGRVFDVNPVAKLNDPTLRDQNGSATAVPDAAYSVVDLLDLAPVAPLAGPNAQIVDVEAPFTVHADPSKPLDTLNRSQPEFQEVNAYFQIDRAQRYLQSLGYAGSRRLVDYSIPIDAHAANGTDNSYFIEANLPGHGTLYFGDGGTDDAEDSDIMLHEFMHAIHNWIAPGALSAGSSSQAAAIAEGLGDYWSFSSTYDATRASGRDPACIADWDARCFGDADSENCGYPAGADCLRRVDSTKTIADFRSSNDPGTEHLNGEIWSSALRDIFLAAGKTTTDRIVIESLFGVPPAPSFHDMAQRMVEADRALTGGANVNVICGAMTLRGIFAAGDCGTPLKGEYTSHPAPISVTPIPDGGTPLTSSITITDPRAIVSLGVRVDIRHPNRGDLVITLVAPDGSQFVLKQSSDLDRTADIHATYGVDAASLTSLTPLAGQSAQGTWTLVVLDKFPGDAGVLESWGLLLKLTGDGPFASRPQQHSYRLNVPVVGHLTGVLGRRYVSDLYLSSRAGTTVTLIYTPTDADGSVNFAALPVVVGAGQVVRVDDVVAQLGTTGMGFLQLVADQAFIATSRTYFRDANGTHGDRVDVTSYDGVSSSDDAYNPLFVGRTYGDYWNIGVVNTTGESGVVSIAGVQYPMAPYSHLQVPGTGNIARITVVSGRIRVLGYASVVEGDDFAFYLAQSLPEGALGAFVMPTSTGGWRSDVWRVGFDGVTPVQPSPVNGIPGPFGIVSVSQYTALFQRIVHGTQSESFPLYRMFFPVHGDIIGIEVSSDFRSNLTVASAFANHITLWDASGNQLQELASLNGSVPITDPRVARISVDLAELAVVSEVDNHSGDGWVIPPQ